MDPCEISKCPDHVGTQNDFLAHLQFPKSSGENKTEFRWECVPWRAVGGSIGHEQWKSPGPEGLPVDISKAFSSKPLTEQRTSSPILKTRHIEDILSIDISNVT